ncbi:hypothetical protein F2Q68_00006672, partial [Brassica cretica]
FDEMKAAKRWSLGNLRDMASSLPGPRHRAPSPSRRRARVYIIMALSLIAFFAVIAYMYPHHSKRACYMISSRGCKALADWLPPSLREYSDDEIAARVVISEILSNPPVIRKDSKIAFMFLTPGALPFERLWDRFFQIAFQLDIFLILKLAAVIFLFNQDGSRQRLALLVIFATIIYLYQTGALAPFIRWLSQGMHRAAVPPPPPPPHRPAARADNDPAAAMPLNQEAVPEGQENEAGDGNRANANENVGAGAGQQGNQWWGIVKEIQMIVFGFITSLLPGFHNID